jgi:hypothetical protein
VARPAAAAATPIRAWLAIASGTALLGAVLVVLLPVDPHANPDSRSFLALARSVAGGSGLAYQDEGAPGLVLRAFRPPLYPLALGGVMAFGWGPGAFLPLQGALYGLAAVAAAWLADRLAGRRAAWIAGASALAWWPAWLAAGQFMTETLYTSLLAAALALSAVAGLPDPLHAAPAGARAKRRGAAFFAGAVAALAVLARATGVAVVAGCGVWLLLRAPRLAPIFLLGLLVLWTPWAARNRAVLGEWVWLQTSGGLNLWAGNGGGTIPQGWEILSRELPARGEVGADRGFYQRAREAAVARPLGTLAGVAEKLLWFVAPRDRSPEYLAYRLAVPLVLLGFVVGWRDPRWSLIAGVWAMHAAVGALTVMNGRYRLPAEWPGLLLGVAGVTWLTERWGAARAAGIAAALVLLGAAAVWLQGALRGAA